MGLLLTLTTLNYFYKPWKPKGVFQFEIIIVSSFWFEYICYRSTVIGNILIFLVRGRLYTSESDVYRRQILTYKDGPRTERVNLTIV